MSPPGSILTSAATSHTVNTVFNWSNGPKDVAGNANAERSNHTRIRHDGDVPKFVPEVAQITFSGQMGHRRGQDVVYVTERCVLRLEPEGLTVVEVAPGVDLEREVLGQAEVTLRVSPELRSMDPRLFRPARLGLHLDAASATPRAQRSNGKVAAA